MEANQFINERWNGGVHMFFSYCFKCLVWMCFSRLWCASFLLAFGGFWLLVALAFGGIFKAFVMFLDYFSAPVAGAFLTAPRNLHFEVHEVLPLPRNLHFEVREVLRLPRSLQLKVLKVLRLPRNHHTFKQIQKKIVSLEEMMICDVKWLHRFAPRTLGSMDHHVPSAVYIVQESWKTRET